MFPSGEPDMLAEPPAKPHPSDRQSSVFSSTEGEIVIFRSCDGVLLNVNRLYLKGTTDGPLAVDVPCTPGEKTPLEEDSETLETLFAFVYPRRHPLLEGLPFAQLFKIAEAAEKYRVFPAMSIANVRMSMAYKEQPLQVMSYACKHGYMDLLDRIAPLSIGTPVASARKDFDYLPLFIAWVQYNDTFHQVEKFLPTLVPTNSHTSCSGWGKVQESISQALTGCNLTPLTIDRVFAGAEHLASEHCGTYAKQQSIDGARERYCTLMRREWMTRVREKVDALPKLTQYLN